LLNAPELLIALWNYVWVKDYPQKALSRNIDSLDIEEKNG
jgi:hypothetical protein